MNTPQNPRSKLKPKLTHALRLKCLYCGQSSLIKPKNPLEFNVGCEHCNYRYEREVGYFSGASWMITFTVAALSAMLSGAFMIWKYEGSSDFVIAGIPALFGGVLALVFIPFGRSIWMYVDHYFHPLTESDSLTLPAKKEPN